MGEGWVYAGDEVEGSPIVRRLKGLCLARPPIRTLEGASHYDSWLYILSNHLRASDFDLKKMDVEGAMRTSPNG